MENYQGITGKKSNFFSLIFFVLGLIGALGFRMILLLNKINYLFASIAWYTAIFSYLFFYGYRLYIEDKRRKIIINNQLREKLNNRELSREDRDRIKTLLDSILVSKLKWNFFILFILTILAFIMQIIVDVFFRSLK